MTFVRLSLLRELFPEMKKSVVVIAHIGYWCLYLVLLSVFALIMKTGKQPGTLPGFGMVRFMIAVALIPGVIGFYTSYTFLFSEYLNKKKIPYLFAAEFAISCVAALIGVIVLPFIFGPNIDSGGPVLMANDGHNLGSAMLLPLNAFINGIIGLVMKGFITWYGGLKLKEETDKKNYEMELALVKSQFNPHFLFNTINNIDVLIEKDAAKASVYLNNLSDMMRFMLYETKTEKIPLGKELAYIDKYIDLQKIRTSNRDYVHYSVEGFSGDMTIAPMLFIPFIENAFKHAGNKKTGNAINIRIKIELSGITFDCENSYSGDAQVKPDQGGLGNELIQKRLQLLYPATHKLEVNNNNNTYKVKLVLYPNGN